MSHKPLVSIIIPFLNAEKFFQEAIESVSTQTYDEWELLLIDDGSTDTSTEIALRYAEQYPGKVRYLEHAGHRNCGVGASRNLGIRSAKGQYIAFLDADDVWLPNKLERQVAILSSQPEAAMVYGTSQYWQSWTGNAEDIHRDFLPPLGVQPDTLFRPPTLLTLLYPLGEGAAPCPSDILLRREVVRRVGGFEESFTGKYQLYEDQAFLAKVYLKEYVFVSGECWDQYRLHPDSCMSVVIRAGQYHTVRFYFLHWLEEYLSKHGIKDRKIWKTLHKALWPYRHPLLSRSCTFLKTHVKILTQNTTSLVSKAVPTFWGQWPKRVQPLQRQMKRLVKSAVQRVLPVSVYQGLQAQQQVPEYSTAVGGLNFGSLRRVTPLSWNWGYDRGLPIDRYYIENFLADNATDIRGRVLEIGDDSYTRRFGGDWVTKSDVLHVVEGNPQATLVADLTQADQIPSDAFNCIILTQTLHLIYDVRAALQTLYRILKPEGVLLATFPGITRISHDEWAGSWFWGFTSRSAQQLFQETFPATNIHVESHGNVLAASAFLYGVATEELRQEELDCHDLNYEVLITVKAVKPGGTGSKRESESTDLHLLEI